jgi:hypothetical protein
MPHQEELAVNESLNPHHNQDLPAPLLALADAVEVFHTPDGEPCITAWVGTSVQSWPVRSKDFRQWLRWRFFDQFGAAPNTSKLRELIELLSGIARFSGPERALFTRVASHRDALYIDLANDCAEVVEVTTDEWRIITAPPVRLYRPTGMLALPRPAEGGSLESLRNFLNVSDEGDLIMLSAWILAALRPTGPYPVLVLHGEQGSGKTTIARILRRLIDPHKILLKGTVRNERDLFIAANNQHVVALDNLSHLQPWLSDALCTIATGGGYSTRRLYTDTDEVNFQVIRPIILNGIEDIATRGDLMDRSIIVYLPTILGSARVDEATLWQQFDAVQSQLFGTLLNTVSCALMNLPSTAITTHSEPPRMLDFALWASAAAPACPWRMETAAGEVAGAEAFMAAYYDNRQAANATTLEASEVAQALLALAEKAGVWKGTATKLLAELRALSGTIRSDQWPKSASAFSGTLRRLAPNLRRAGVSLDFGREAGGKQRTITLRGV